MTDPSLSAIIHFMLIDEVDIIIKAGHGGPGRVAFFSKKGTGPSGGDGGKGGNVFMVATSNLYGLGKFISQAKLEAENGEPGSVNRKSGGDGKNLILTMPIGTVLIDEKGNETELVELNKQVLLAEGGMGGKGNYFFKSSGNTTPRFAQPGLPGGEKKLKLHLRLIADFGLIGLPNAGKSSLLNEITSSEAKIGAYPFTTLEPNLGMLNGKTIADIPGLIEGASEGKGLGDKFLKHIEKVTLLLHCISSESENPFKDYQIIRNELEKFNPKLLEKDEIIILTKSDLLDEKGLKNKLKTLSKTKIKIIPVSIHNWDRLQELTKKLNQ